VLSCFSAAESVDLWLCSLQNVTMETSYARKAKYCAARRPPLERLVYHNQGRFQFERFCALSARLIQFGARGGGCRALEAKPENK
jgi:hypothetical protein